MPPPRTPHSCTLNLLQVQVGITSTEWQWRCLPHRKGLCREGGKEGYDELLEAGDMELRTAFQLLQDCF